jgi:hypothetical protein
MVWLFGSLWHRGVWWSFYDGAEGRPFEMEQFLLHRPSVPKWWWYGMMTLPIFLFTPYSFFFSSEIFERVGPRERRLLRDPFGAIQCELGITFLCVLKRTRQQPQPQPGLSLTPCAVCFCFWTLHWIKATSAAGKARGSGEQDIDRFGPL